MKRSALLLIALLIIVNLSVAATYYNRTGTTYCNNLASWTTSSTGGIGTSPANFTTSGDIFEIRSGTTMTQSGAWNIGPASGNITINIRGTLENYSNYAMTFNTNTTLVVFSGATFLKSSTGLLTLPPVATTTFQSGSTMNFTRGCNQFAPQYTYGNLIFNDAFDGPPVMGSTYPLKVLNNLTILRVTEDFVFSTNASLTHSIGGDLIIDDGGIENVIVSNGTGNPTLNIGGKINILQGSLFLSNGSGHPVLNVSGMVSVTSSFSYLYICNSTGDATLTSGSTTVTDGYYEVKSLTATGTNDPLITINGTLSTAGSGTFSINRSGTAGSNPVVNVSGNVTIGGTSIFQMTTNVGTATMTVGSPTALANLTSSGGTVHVSNDVDCIDCNIGNTTLNIYGDLYVAAGGHVDLSYNNVGGNNIINVWGSAYMQNPTTDLFGGPHCQTRTDGLVKLILKSPVGITPVAGKLSTRAGNYGGGAGECTTGADARTGIAQYNIEIESGREITLYSNIELGTNRNFIVHTGATLITGVGTTPYVVGRRTGCAPPLCLSPGPATNTTFVLSSGSTIDAYSTTAGGALMKTGTFTGNVQTDNRTYSSGADYKFTAAAAQQTGDFSTMTTPTANTVNRLIVNNSNATISTGLTLTNSLSITTELRFLAGRLKTTSTTLPTVGTAATATGYGTTSANTKFVDGPLAKNFNSTSPFTFPVGKSTGAGLYRPAMLTPSASTAYTLVTEFMYTGTTGAGYSTASMFNPIVWVEPSFFWHVVRTSATNVNSAITLFYDNGDTVSTYDYTTSAQWNNIMNRWEGTGATGGSPTPFRSVGASPALATIPTSANRPFTLAGGSPAPLPVELVEFTAQAFEKTNVLKWVTASERINDRFVVEKSSDGKQFSKIGEVKGCGTCNYANEYTFTDERRIKPSNYYRLKQVDFDGTEHYSDVIHLESNRTQTQIFPNPCIEKVSVNGIAIERICLYGSRGEKVKELIIEPTEGFSSYNLELADLPAGVYMMTIYAGGELITSEKLLKNE